MVAENDRRKKFRRAIGGPAEISRSHHRYFRKPETRLPHRGPDRRQTVRRFAAASRFCKQISR